jgi:uncharacterized damage-inducible protein DinB
MTVNTRDRAKDRPMTNSLPSLYRRLARYNTLANRRVYACCADLDDAERCKPRLAYFGSIHGTLNHILVGDRIWMARFAGRTAPSTGLDAVLFEDFAALHRERVEEDARIEAFARSVDDAYLNRSIAYRNNEGRMFDDPTPLLLTHFFNHQTHHRGQIHDMLSQTPVPPPVLDLHRVLKPDPEVPIETA